jgi:polynucleotide 5'-hydroxyl-kinase GRC3/NOL9
MADLKIDIPAEWNKSGLEDVSGLVMVIGQPNTGKSTLAAYLYGKLGQREKQTAYLDGDPGQSTLGPPTTITLALSRSGGEEFPPKGKKLRKFVASTSPKGHMLPLLVAASRLIAYAKDHAVKDIIYDTTGLVDPAQGGLALKYAKIDLLTPEFVLAIQKEDELEPLLSSLKGSRRTQVIRLRPSPVVIRRETADRQHHRARKYREYFSSAGTVRLDWRRYAIYPAPRFALQRLVGLEDHEGFTLGLGIVLELDRAARQVVLLTPLVDLSAVKGIYLGGVLVDPETYRDKLIGS